ncbi:methionine ABC transporter ATP-binding protein [Anaerosphaera multitolerans]|uniref:ATP-binding cassette domain-containing protein n=1 Tax=Anaerosphaera multitolerans TaxID=2487351 RepID=A0A437S8K1_9FIRM|nr:ATP-binding cassette domain-containing protein [Anaerosphaera multitolerans]RVU55157.1 ATP-binding cassette domain-containing protein [Anaerosphaera multitolerans]
MIEVKNLKKSFENEKEEFHAVNGVSFSVEKGEIFGIIGLSGAGKSTLVRCINRLEEPNEGEVLIDGVDILKLSKEELLKERKEIGMIFQSFNLFMQKTVAENISFPLEISKVPKTEIEKRVDELLEFIDLKEKKYSYPAELSGGQKQRVAIARAIATNPKVLLSDEGTSALDPANTESILSLFKKIVTQYKMTIIMITHQMEVAKDICDRIAVMDSGKIIEENTTEELFRNPKNKITRSFIKNLQEDAIEEKLIAEKFKGSVYRLGYGESTYQAPILSRCMKNYDVELSIISGNVNTIGQSSVGHLNIEITGDEAEKEKAIDYLKENGVTVEEIK